MVSKLHELVKIPSSVKIPETLKVILVSFIFCLGLTFIYNYTHTEFMEAFVNEKNDDNKDNDAQNKNCHDVLIQKGAKIYLFNSKLTYVPGVNPVIFNNLDEYTDYINWERANGLNCPVLFLQQSFDAQNNSVYSTRPSPHDPQGGNENVSAENLPGNLSSKMQKFESVYDNMSSNDNKSRGKLSTNPMDSNWGGNKFSEKIVKDQLVGKKERDSRFDTIYQ